MYCFSWFGPSNDREIRQKSIYFSWSNFLEKAHIAFVSHFSSQKLHLRVFTGGRDKRVFFSWINTFSLSQEHFFNEQFKCDDSLHYPGRPPLTFIECNVNSCKISAVCCSARLWTPGLPGLVHLRGEATRLRLACSLTRARLSGTHLFIRCAIFDAGNSSSIHLAKDVANGLVPYNAINFKFTVWFR